MKDGHQGRVAKVGCCDAACETNGNENDCNDQLLGAENPEILAAKILTPHPLQ